MHEPAVLDSAGFFCDALHLFLDKVDAAFGPLLDLVFRRVLCPTRGHSLSPEFILGADEGCKGVEERAQCVNAATYVSYGSRKNRGW